MTWGLEGSGWGVERRRERRSIPLELKTRNKHTGPASPAKCDINYNLYIWGHLAGAKGPGQPERVCAGRGAVTDRVRFPDTGVGKRGSVREHGPPGVRVWRRDCPKSSSPARRKGPTIRRDLAVRGDVLFRGLAGRLQEKTPDWPET